MVLRVAQLLTTPVKGFGVHESSALAVNAHGVVGSRDFFLVDDRNVLFSVTRSGTLMKWWAHHHVDGLSFGIGPETVGTFPVELGEEVRTHFYDDRYVDARVVLGSASAFLSEVVGRSVRLVKAIHPSGGYDTEPLTVISRASVGALGYETDQSPLDSQRFRLDVTLDGAQPFEEDAWCGRELQVGSARIRISTPIPRCVSITRNARTGHVDVDVLRRIRQVRGVTVGVDGLRSLDLGVYATVTVPGTIAVHDPILLD